MRAEWLENDYYRVLGVPGPNGSGDLLVTLVLAVPDHLDGDEYAAVEALARVMTWSPRSEEE